MMKLKRWICLAVAAVCLVMSAGSVLAEPAALTVNGTATVTVPADQAAITLGTVTNAASAGEASEENARALNTVIAALKEAGISPEDISTESCYIYPEYRDGGASTYQVSNNLRIIVRDVARAGELMDIGLKAGANQCYGISFQSTKASDAYDEALAAACREAERKALLAAEACGKKLGQLVSLTEGYGSYGGVSMTKDEASARSATPVMADGLSFTATVTMVFEME